MPGIGRERFLYTAIKRMGLRHNYNLILSILKRFFPNVYECVKENRCPFCRQEFGSRYQLLMHLRRKNTCRKMFLSISKKVTEIHDRVRYHIKARSKRRYIVTINSRYRLFSSIDEALDYLLQHLDTYHTI